MVDDQASRRAVFDDDAELYDRARPSYPDELFSELRQLGGLSRGARVVEIGPGTGQATRGLLAMGAHVTAIELGPALAAKLTSQFPGSALEVVVSAFEDWLPPTEPFDAVVAFTSWHWIDPNVSAPKIAGMLRPSGVLATTSTAHIAGGTEEFFERAQLCYELWDPATPSGLRLQLADQVPSGFDEIDTSELFLPAARRRFTQEITYPAAEYLAVLGTYSGHRTLPAERRQGLLDCIEDLIKHDYRGQITKCYLHETRIARRRS